MTFERYIAVSQPLRASQICTIKRARYMLLLVLTVFFLINAHFLWTFHLIPSVSHCIPLNDQSLFIKYFTWIDSFKYSFCPFTVLITLNILIIRSLLNARNTNKFLQQQTPNGNHCNQHATTYSISFSSTSTTNNSANSLIRKNKSKHAARPSHPSQPNSTKVITYRRVNRRLTTMLLTVSFAFCICSMPISIMQLIDAIYSDVEQRSSMMNAGIVIGKIIAEISQYINHCKSEVWMLKWLGSNSFSIELLPVRIHRSRLSSRIASTVHLSSFLMVVVVFVFFATAVQTSEATDVTTESFSRCSRSFLCEWKTSHPDPHRPETIFNGTVHFELFRELHLPSECLQCLFLVRNSIDQSHTSQFFALQRRAGWTFPHLLSSTTTDRSTTEHGNTSDSGDAPRSTREFRSRQRHTSHIRRKSQETATRSNNPVARSNHHEIDSKT